MKTPHPLLPRLKSERIVAILRFDSPEVILQTIESLAVAGVRFVEITTTVPDAVSQIARCVEAFKDDVVIGAGTVLSGACCKEVIDAGARFVVSPVTVPEVIDVCREAGVMSVPGAMTPSEVYHAWCLGADILKVFSARAGGAKYFRDLKGPFPQIEIMPTGGVDKDTAPAFLQAGACAIGVGGALVPSRLVYAGEYAKVTENARNFLRTVRGE
jgi:2-dehydro-3-deoxyphosphogluconate aldolase / (4S)-4-hydroxy-2-oxoglutarate aldolase